MVNRIIFFLSSADLICRGTDISKYFRESLGIQVNESRLYTTGLLAKCTATGDKIYEGINQQTSSDSVTYERSAVRISYEVSRMLSHMRSSRTKTSPRSLIRVLAERLQNHQKFVDCIKGKLKALICLYQNARWSKMGLFASVWRNGLAQCGPDNP